MVEAEERLRREIAEELHSGLQTRLLLASFRHTERRALIASDPAQAVAVLDGLVVELYSIRAQNVRQVSHGLHPAITQIDLGPAVASLLANHVGELMIAFHADKRVHTLDDLMHNRLSAELRLAAYRVVRRFWRMCVATRMRHV